MQIRELGEEAIAEILSEAVDGMDRRTGKPWRLVINNEHGDLRISCAGKYVTTANVRPVLALVTDDEPHPPEAIRFRSALRRNILQETQAISPVPGAADVPAALARAFSAIAAVDAASAQKDVSILPSVRHDLHRILDHLTGFDRSGCSTAPSASDNCRTQDPNSKRCVPLQADIAAVRAAVEEAEACTDLNDGEGQGHATALRDTLDSLLADQRREAEAMKRKRA